MARRRNRHRREARRAREHHEAPEPDPVNREKGISHWKQKLGTMTAKGFIVPPFAGLVFGPVMRVDLDLV